MNENIIRTISSEMNRYLNNYQLSKLQEVLYKKVEIEKKEISNEEYVNKFINSKRLEGCSKLTIKNYMSEMQKKGIIERKNGKRDGEWIILKSSND